MAKTTKLQAAKSWIMLGFLILVSFTVILLSREQQDLFTGRAAIQNIGYLKAGSQEFIETKGISGLFGVTVVFGADTKNNQLKVEENNRLSFAGNFYSKFTVSWKDPTTVERMEFRLKVLEEELYRKGINPADLRLYANGKELRTIPSKSEGRYRYYTASSGEEGDYVIGRRQEQSSQPTTVVPAPETKRAGEEIGEEVEGVIAPLGAEGGEQVPALPEELPASAVPPTGQAIQQPAAVTESSWQRLVRTLKKIFGK